jgi:hypothetical protein
LPAILLGFLVETQGVPVDQVAKAAVADKVPITKAVLRAAVVAVRVLMPWKSLILARTLRNYNAASVEIGRPQWKIAASVWWLSLKFLEMAAC